MINPPINSNSSNLNNLSNSDEFNHFNQSTHFLSNRNNDSIDQDHHLQEQHQEHEEEEDDPSDDEEEEEDDDDESHPSHTTTRLSTPTHHSSTLVNRISTNSLLHRPTWPTVQYDEEDDEEIWDINSGRQAASPDETVLARRMSALTVINPASHGNHHLPNNNHNLHNLHHHSSSSHIQSNHHNLISSLSNSTVMTSNNNLSNNSNHHSIINSHHNLNPTEEWRFKIIDCVRRGEEKVAKRRKESLIDDHLSNSTSQSSNSIKPTSNPTSPTSPSTPTTVTSKISSSSKNLINPINNNLHSSSNSISQHLNLLQSSTSTILPSTSNSSCHLSLPIQSNIILSSQSSSSSSNDLKGKTSIVPINLEPDLNHLDSSSSFIQSAHQSSLNDNDNSNHNNLLNHSINSNLLTIMPSSSSSSSLTSSSSSLSDQSLPTFQITQTTPSSSINNLNQSSSQNLLNSNLDQSKPSVTIIKSNSNSTLNNKNLIPIEPSLNSTSINPSSDPSMNLINHSHNQISAHHLSNSNVSQTDSNNFKLPQSSITTNTTNLSTIRQDQQFTESPISYSQPSSININNRLSDHQPLSLSNETFLNTNDSNISSRSLPRPSSAIGPISNPSQVNSPNHSNHLHLSPDSSLQSPPRKPQGSPIGGKTGKRNFFSSLLQRASGSYSTPTSPGLGSSSGSRNLFDSTLNRSSHPIDCSRSLSLGLNSKNDYGSNGWGSEGSSVDNPNRSNSNGSNLATIYNLASMNLKLTPLTPQLTISRNSQPLCGAILDNKYLLIGTNNGLDFVPLTPILRPHSNRQNQSSSVSIGTVKPISLIKKTRFKSLKVLEVRSNILLAIAGRNDHLRVYALDGIRAIITKKIQDLQDKDEFIWLSKPSIPGPTSKGKGRSTNPQFNQNLSSPSYSPPPAYGSNSQSMIKSNSFQPATSTAFDVTGSPSLNGPSLRRSSTVDDRGYHQMISNQASSGNRRSSFHSHSIVKPSIELLTSDTLVPLSSQQSEHLASSPENTLNTINSTIQSGSSQQADHEHNLNQFIAATHAHDLNLDGQAFNHEGNQSNSSSLTDIDRVDTLNTTQDLSNSVPSSTSLGENPYKNQSNDKSLKLDSSQSIQTNQAERSTTGLIEVIKSNTQQSGKSTKQRSSHATHLASRSKSRLVPRSPLATDTDEDSTDGNGNRVTLVDVLSQPLPKLNDSNNDLPISHPLEITISAPCRDSFTTSISEGEERLISGNSQSTSLTRSATDNGQSHRNYGSNLLTSNNLNSNSESNESNSGLIRNPSSLLSSIGSNNPNLPISSTNLQNDLETSTNNTCTSTNSTHRTKSKKRWSVMDSVFRSNSSPSNHQNVNSSSNSNSQNQQLHSRYSNEENSSNLIRDTSNHSNQNRIESQSNTNNIDLRPRSSTQKLRASTLNSNQNLTQENHGAMSENSINERNRISTEQQMRDFTIFATTSNITVAPNLNTLSQMGSNSHDNGFEDQPRERLATHHHGQNLNEATKTSPHPASFGAPLEYVKLARTKGSRLLRALETTRRTYLAVLCGESSERIELFTGSKNISLSLNRTFVLPETPRTIEFQMQGDDLVDIYLVYDDSVFALEPATVRVREVGIGRNERRAARRERERAVRDLASINMRPSVTTTGEVAATINDVGAFLASTPGGNRPLAETVGLTQRSTTPPISFPIDEGLTLSAPVQPPTSRQPSRPHSSLAGSVGPGGNSTVVSAGNLAGLSLNEGQSTSTPNNGKATNLFPYTTFQQLQFIPPLPPSVLASTFVIPPTYETVVLAGGGPKPIEAPNQPVKRQEEMKGSGSNIRVQQFQAEDMTIRVELAADQSSNPGDRESDCGIGGSSNAVHENGNKNLTNLNSGRNSLNENGEQERVETESNRSVSLLSAGPLLSPVSLLTNPTSQQIGPPGLFLVTRGKKVTSIVDCDGRSVMKKPFVWSNDRHSKPTAISNNHGFRIEVMVVEDQRTLLVGLNSSEVKISEVGGKQAKGLEEYSNSAILEIVPQFILGQSVGNNGISTNSSSNGSSFGNLSNSLKLGGGGGTVGTLTAHALLSIPNFSMNGLNGSTKWNESSHNKDTIDQNGHNINMTSQHGGGLGSSGKHLLENREITFLGSNENYNYLHPKKNENNSLIVWSEKVGNLFGIYCLSKL
ncbi:hypothetical protein O181_001717 [Austropuccinia psidii MF-1]|uniref:CNH domain-containing protein n=1 Tax=Austropuccinia psidii MF-1 TaxID=1389203 RepID=A0A9Q3BBD0_9BASI|nr:hypothetical protein [Austropuccinia psidii MF-1]